VPRSRICGGKAAGGFQLASLGGQAASPGASVYHATKWGVEGFLEEVAPFGIGCTLIEPGSARTDFTHRNALLASELEAYDISPSRMLNRIVADRSQLAPGDPINGQDHDRQC